MPLASASMSFKSMESVVVRGGPVNGQGRSVPEVGARRDRADRGAAGQGKCRWTTPSEARRRVPGFGGLPRARGGVVSGVGE